MAEVSEAYIKQVQSAFSKFTSLYDNSTWISSATTEDIKTAFKLANFVEKAAKHFEDNGFLQEFLNNLNELQIINPYSSSIFCEAGDLLLYSFFSHQGVTEFKLDLAIRMYTSFNTDRLENVLTTVMLQSSSYEAILDFALSNSKFINRNSLQYILFLNKLTDNYEKDIVKVKDHILSMVSLYKIEIYLDLLIGILALREVDTKMEDVRRLILDALVSKMYDRSVVSKPFWLCLLRRVDKTNLVNTCMNCKVFLDSLCRFIVYIGSMMQSKTVNNEVVWCSNPNISICPEITYSEIVNTLRLLQENEKTRESVQSKIVEVCQQTESLIWHSVELDLKNSECSNTVQLC